MSNILYGKTVKGSVEIKIYDCIPYAFGLKGTSVSTTAKILKDNGYRAVKYVKICGKSGWEAQRTFIHYGIAA